MKNSTCFVTVIFNENITYFNDFLISLEEQTNKHFDLLIFNDGVSNLNKITKSFKGTYQIIDIPKNLSISENRSFVLSCLKKSDYQYCVFGDSDDYFPKNRVEINLNYLKTHDIIVNDTHLVDQNKNSIIETYFNIENEQEIKFQDILSKNCCGLGNTAININALPQNTNFNTEIAAVDWMLFSRMLYEGKSAIYTNQTYIYYRQHDLNSIGLKSINKERLLRGIKIKISHYKNLIEEYGICNLELEQLKKLSGYCSNSINLEKYTNKILSLNLNNPMWWEEIKTLKELNLKA
jgi:hypothetical protein